MVRRVIPLVCAYWKAGRCKRHPCIFLHSDGFIAAANHRHRRRAAAPPSQDPAEDKTKTIPPGARRYDKPTGCAQEKPKAAVPCAFSPAKKIASAAPLPARPAALQEKVRAAVPCAFSPAKKIASAAPLPARPASLQEKVRAAVLSPSPASRGQEKAKLTTNAPRLASHQPARAQEKPELIADTIQADRAPRKRLRVLTGVNPAPPPKRVKQLRGRGTAEAVPALYKYPTEVCADFLAGNCTLGWLCPQRHAWSIGNDFAHVATLHGHHKAITGIAFSSVSDKLFSGSKDGSVRVWDCNSCKCVQTINLGLEVGCMISKGPWVFVGIPDSVKAWNMENGSDISLVGPKGQVYALAASDKMPDMIFAGSRDGIVSAWKLRSVGSLLEPSASLLGHKHAVVALIVGAGRLYSGSVDHMIKARVELDICPPVFP